MSAKRILLIIGGGIAAYKTLDFVRRARERGVRVRAVMTKAATAFVTPLSVGAITGERVYTELFDRDDEHDIGHIRLAREADLIVVAPATADFMAKMAGGHADDLASTIILAADAPVLVAPAMNPKMWAHPATERNVGTLTENGVSFIGPNAGEMAEAGEAGLGRMAEPLEILHAAEALLGTGASAAAGPLTGRRVLITAGPTHEPIDPVRYIANRSSGKQGYAIAEAARDAGADVVLISGPTGLAPPSGVEAVQIETAAEMLAAVESALPADAAIFAAAVADWRVGEAGEQKIKKAKGAAPPALALVENPDILATISKRASLRPGLVVGFAAETQNVIANARAKRKRKGCDWIVANDVSPATGIMGGERNSVHLITETDAQAWPDLPKDEVARRLIARIAEHLASTQAET